MGETYIVNECYTSVIVIVLAVISQMRERPLLDFSCRRHRSSMLVGGGGWLKIATLVQLPC